ncbi:MAG: hypothetical protein IKQ77_08055 [Prevotella sp.]|nr:hypothetical protein [Prevotella sp.]
MNTTKNYLKSLLAVLCLVAMTVCSEDPKAEATAFANRFSSYVAQNQLDSIRAVYPDAAECDSFAVKFNPDSLTVEADAQPDTYKVSVGGGVDFVVVKDKDGKWSVTSSHGLVAFNADDLAFAKSVGQYKEGLTDVQLARRMGMKEFKDGLVSSFVKDLQSKVKTGRINRDIHFPEYMADEGIGAVTVTNGTGKTIDGSDYVIILFADGQHGSGSYRAKGNSIPANGSTNVRFTYAGNSYVNSAMLTFVIPDQQLFVKYFEAKGTEFDEYLKANDVDLDKVAEGQKTAGDETAPAKANPAEEDAAVEQFIRKFYTTYVLGDAEFAPVAKKYCSPKLLKKLKADYDFDDGGYAIWDFRSGQQDGNGKSEVKSVKRVRDGLVYEVEMLDMGHPHTALVSLVKTEAGDFLFDDVK